MPVYLCSTPSGSLDSRGRQQIADEITRIHCETTGAPPTFAHVIFRDSEETGSYAVFGTIRAGRPAAVKERIVSEMAEAVAKTVGVEADDVTVTTRDVPASWVMEGGALLPEPGEEEAWLARHGH